MGAYETQGFKMDNTGRRIVVDPVTRIEGVTEQGVGRVVGALHAHLQFQRGLGFEGQ